MSAFREALDQLQRRRGGARRWIYAPYDQLSDAIGPLSRTPPGEAGLVLVESPQKAARRPYHRQKLALVLANLRHFALEQARRGVLVRHLVGDPGPVLRVAAADLGPIELMRPAERELRMELAPLCKEGLLREGPHEGFLTSSEDFSRWCEPPYRMDAFYRGARRATGILMVADKPEGGRFSFDGDNRKPWRGKPEAPPSPRFPRDAIKDEVCALVLRDFARHPGSLDPDALPATLADAASLWARALGVLPQFGPFEDAMSARSHSLFHTRVSGLLNLHRLLPERLVREAAASSAPLQSREGFVRQILGWREFVRHVHDATDGFRDLPGTPHGAVPAAPGDGGFARWAGRAWEAPPGPVPLGGARPSVLGADSPLPPAYWGAPSGLRCLDTVVAGLWREGYSHHITRLMVLSNLAQLLEVSPRELTDWFWVAYVDAYDWVVEPNVLAMGTWGAGGVMTTKPYVSGAAYIDRMSDYCGDCRFDPRKDCPITPLYWRYLARHAPALQGNPRMLRMLQGAKRRTAAQRERDEAVFQAVQSTLLAGEELEASRLPR